MTRRVVWAKAAQDDMRALVAYAAETSPDTAQRIADAIRHGGNALGRHDTGRPGRVPGTREKSLPAIHQIICYRIEPERGGERITILRVVHTARDWRKGHLPPT